MSDWQTALADSGWNSLYFNNHDQPRAVSRFGNDGPWRDASAKMLATCLHGLRGTPYVYQGEELGMGNYPFTDLGQCRDIETLNMARAALHHSSGDPAAVLAGLLAAVRAKGRDNARTPMQWTAGPHAGFSRAQPWLAVHPNHATLNAEAALADAGSVFHHYRQLIALRRSEPALVHGRYALLWPEHAAVFGYTRTLGAVQLLVVCSFSDQPVALPLGRLDLAGAEPLLANWPLPDGLAGRIDTAAGPAAATLLLRPYEALLLRRHLPPARRQSPGDPA